MGIWFDQCWRMNAANTAALQEEDVKCYALQSWE